MPIMEPAAPLRLLRAGYAPDDWVALFLKSYATNETCQRVVPITQDRLCPLSRRGSVFRMPRAGISTAA